MGRNFGLRQRDRTRDVIESAKVALYVEGAIAAAIIAMMIAVFHR